MSYNKGVKTRQQQKDVITSNIWSTLNYDINSYSPDLFKGVMTAFYMESDFGARGDFTSRYRGISQIGPNIDSDFSHIFPELSYRDSDPNRYNAFISDPGNSAQVYFKVTSDYMGSKNWKDYKIMERGMELGYDPELIRYLSWQQGKAGAADVISTISYYNPNSKVQSNRMPGDAKYTGNLSGHTFYNLVHQLNSADRKAFLPYLVGGNKKTIDYSKVGGKGSSSYKALQASLLNAYMNTTITKWDSYSKKASTGYDNYIKNKPEDRMMNQFVGEDTMISNKQY